MKERIVRRHDANVGTIERRDEADRVGQSGMVRDEEDRTAPRDSLETRDFERRGEVVQAPARRFREWTRREDLVARGKLARDPLRSPTKERSRDGSARPAAFPAERFGAFAREEVGERLDLIHGTPTTRRATSRSDGFADALALDAPRSITRIAVRGSRASSSAPSASRVSLSRPHRRTLPLPTASPRAV